MKIRKLTRAGLVVLLCAGILACSSSGGSDDGDDSSAADDTGGDGGVVVSQAELDGSWATGCIVDAPFSVSYTIVIANQDLTFTETEYADAACAMVMTVNVINFTLSLGAALTLDGSVDGITSATELDLTITTPGSADLGDVVYDIIAIQANNLYLGDIGGANDGSTPALRPTQLGADLVFQKS